MSDINRFAVLNSINVSDHIEKKNGLSYLSWVWAWSELKKRYPNSYYTIYERPDGCIYWTDGKTCWVKTGVTLVDDSDPEHVYSQEHIEYLYVMDYKNNSIPLERVTSKDVNTTIQRSITKAIARHGLGAYVYAGEDLPEETPDGRQQRLEAEEAMRQLKSEITELGKQIVSSVGSEDEKVEFFNSVFVPTIGMQNHLACNDIDKLTLLKEKLVNICENNGKKKASKKKDAAA